MRIGRAFPGAVTPYRIILAIIAATERRSTKTGAAVCHGNEEGAIPLSDLRRKWHTYIQKRDILSNRLNAGILQKRPGILRIS